MRRRSRNDAFLRRSRRKPGSTFPGRKRIVKSNTESNRVESEGPESAVLHVGAHGRASVSSAPGRERTQDAGRLHLAYMYVLCQRAFCICAVATSSSEFFSLSFFLPDPTASRSVLPFSIVSASFLLIKSRRPPLYPAFRLPYLFFSSTRASRIARCRSQRTRKSAFVHKKKGGGEKHIKILRWYS